MSNVRACENFLEYRSFVVQPITLSTKVIRGICIYYIHIYVHGGSHKRTTLERRRGNIPRWNSANHETAISIKWESGNRATHSWRSNYTANPPSNIFSFRSRRVGGTRHFRLYISHTDLRWIVQPE